MVSCNDNFGKLGSLVSSIEFPSTIRTSKIRNIEMSQEIRPMHS